MISLEEYKINMKEKHKDVLEIIDNKLLSANSWSRGRLLYELLEESYFCPDELKYYVFLNWWSSIDSYHNNFDESSIGNWIYDAEVDINEVLKEKLNFDNEGYMLVYRGTHEFNQSWQGLSWTTDKDVAIKFANGCGVRHQTKSPVLLTGKVHFNNVLAIFTDRQESEVLCECIEKIDSEKLYQE